MTIVQLEYVIALDTYRHYVTASKKCFVTQPTLTMQVKKLEEELGALLFDRSRKPLKPTRIGEQFIEKSREIIREVKQLEGIVLEELESLSEEKKLEIGSLIDINKAQSNFSEEGIFTHFENVLGFSSLRANLNTKRTDWLKQPEPDWDGKLFYYTVFNLSFQSYSIPIFFKYNFFSNQKYIFSAKTGVNFRWYFSSSKRSGLSYSSKINGTTYDTKVYIVETRINPNRSIQIDNQTAVPIGFILKNKKILNLSLFANFT